MRVGIRNVDLSRERLRYLKQIGAEEQTEAIKQLLRNMGEAGIPILGYQWNPRARDVVFSTSRSKEIRGEATTREFDMDTLENPRKASDPNAPEYDEAAF
jgi:mannonate dehydratase